MDVLIPHNLRLTSPEERTKTCIVVSDPTTVWRASECT